MQICLQNTSEEILKKKPQIFLYSRFSLVHSFGFFSLLTTFKDMSVSGYVTPPILCNVGDQGRTW